MDTRTQVSCSMNGDHVKASPDKLLLSSCSFPATTPKPRPHPAGSQKLQKELPELPGVNKHCRYLFMPEPPGAAETPRQGLEAARGAQVLTQRFCANWGRTCPSPAFTLICPQLLRVRSVCKGYPTPILSPSAAALTLGEFLTSSSSPHSPPAAAFGSV